MEINSKKAEAFGARKAALVATQAVAASLMSAGAAFKLATGEQVSCAGLAVGAACCIVAIYGSVRSTAHGAVVESRNNSAPERPKNYPKYSGYDINLP